jgi:pimeloyl-ACP methyl ester carboxylesterase
MSSIEQWWARGETVTLELSGAQREVFVARAGDGPTLTLLHGFPSSSHDWARVSPVLAERHALLMPDFLGFGASAKPAGHPYSLHEQADLVQELWRREGVRRTALVGHDYAVSVVQELLARRSEGALGTGIDRITLLNGGVYPDLHRPQPTQTLLLDPEHGPTLSANVNEELFAASLRPTFADAYDPAGDSAAMWGALHRDEGQRNMHLLIRYMTDRDTHEQRWVRALERSDVPLAFVWGMLDPVSGAHMAERIRERLPAAPLLALGDVAHWPPLEAPERVAEALLDD